MLCFLSRLREKGRSLAVSASSCIEDGRARFSPDTRRIGNTTDIGREGVEGVGVCVLFLKGDLETRLLLRTCLKLEEVRRTTLGPCGRAGESRFAILKGEVTDPELEEDGI